MTEIAKSDLFFFISTISLVVITILICTFIIYGFFILRKLKRVVDRVKEEGEEILEDIHDLRLKLKESDNAMKRAGAFFFFFKNIFGKKR